MLVRPPSGHPEHAHLVNAWARRAEVQARLQAAGKTVSSAMDQRLSLLRYIRPLEGPSCEVLALSECVAEHGILTAFRRHQHQLDPCLVPLLVRPGQDGSAQPRQRLPPELL